jgi:dTDP-4-amino-4,6-dideoxygalactose transaminase
MVHRTKRLYLSPPHMSGLERKYVSEVFDSNWIAPMGPEVDAFERDLAGYTGMKYAAVLNSGTSAIHLALMLLGVGPGDFVAVQSFTFSATVNPVAYLGATPILIDSERETWNMDPGLLEEAVRGMGYGVRGKEKPGTDQKMTGKIKAIIGVNLYGMPAKWDEILTISKKYDIPVIEDAAESLGSRYDGRMCGSIGKFGILSFNGNKIITTSGGGALLSNDKEMTGKARFLSTQARDNAPHYQHSEIGYNYRMSNLLAAVGRGQLEVIDERVAARRAINQSYREAFAGIPGIAFHTAPSDKYFSNYWLTSITVDPEKTGGTTREDIRLTLEAENIESRPLWKPMHMQPVFSGCPAFINGVSEALFNNGLCLPSGSNMTENDLTRVTGIVMKTINRNQLNS